MTTRDELEITMSQLYSYYSIIREKEQQRQLAINWICWISAVSILLGLFLIRVAYGPITPRAQSWTHFKLNVYFPTLGFVIWAGLMGGFASPL